MDNKVPTTRTVNSKALSANITLSASDVGAAASSHNHSGTYLERDTHISKASLGGDTMAVNIDSSTFYVPLSQNTTITNVGSVFYIKRIYMTWYNGARYLVISWTSGGTSFQSLLKVDTEITG